MLFKDVKIAKEPIIQAARKWCVDWRGAALYYMRDRDFVTIEDVYEDFEDHISYIEKETECERCGSTVTEEVEEQNQTIGLEELSTLFTDMGDSEIHTWIAACEEIGLDWYLQPVNEAWIRGRDWTWKKLWSVWLYGYGERARFFETEVECREWISREFLYHHRAGKYLIQLMDNEDTRMEVVSGWRTYEAGWRETYCLFDTESEARNNVQENGLSGKDYILESPEGGTEIINVQRETEAAGE
jgi:hypothetical protein